MAKPTHEDALIMIQLAQWAATLGMSEAASWMWSDEFIPDGDGFAAKYPAGSEGFRKLLTIGNYYETVGTLWKNGLFNETLLFDWLSLAMMWDRVKGPLLRGREESGVPALWENFEAMAKAQAAQSQ
jgi:hypothetical protein